MPIDPNAIGVRTESKRFEWTDRETLLYALGVGCGTADLAYLPAFMVAASLRRLPLPPAPFVVLARRGHRHRRLTLARYLELGHVLIAPRGAPGGIVDALLERMGRSRRVVARVQHFLAAAFVVASSELVVTVPQTLFAATAPDLPLDVLTPPLALAADQTSVVWHDRVHADPGHRWLRTHLKQLVPRR